MTRSQVPKKLQQKILTRIIKAYLTEHPDEVYTQGYSMIAATCMLMFKLTGNVQSDDESVIYQIFKNLMNRHFQKMYASDANMKPFAHLAVMSGKTMDILREHEPRLYRMIIRRDDESIIGHLLTEVYLLWFRRDIFSDPISNPTIPTQQVLTLLDVWTFILSFPDSSRAVSTMVAAMLITKQDRIKHLFNVDKLPIAGLFGGKEQWDWPGLKAKCIELY